MPPANLDNVVSVEVGSGYFIALKSDGTLVAWTRNGASSKDLRVVEHLPRNLKDVVQISAASAWGIALINDGSVVTWGLPEARFRPPYILPKA